MDLHQAHYYAQAERDQTKTLAEQVAALDPLQTLTKPLWMGELPAEDPSETNYSLEAALDICRKGGVAGAAVWRWREPEPDGADVSFGAADGSLLQAWLERSAEERV